MKKSHLVKSVSFVAALLLTAATAVAQQPAQPSEQQAPVLELYHIHVSKAAPGKLTQLIDAYQNAPAPEASQPQITPIILRHREGGEWDLITITPLGKQTTLTASAPRQAVQEYFTRLGPLSEWHGDTFVVGPSWAVGQKALVPAKDAQAVYVVSDYRSLAGHRSQLRQILDRNAQDTPGRSVLFAHVEGGSLELPYGHELRLMECYWRTPAAASVRHIAAGGRTRASRAPGRAPRHYCGICLRGTTHSLTANPGWLWVQQRRVQ